MFWERFYQLCIESGSKPNPVAKSIGVSSGAVTKWKNGTIPPADVLISISEYFNCSIDYLLGRADVQRGIIGDNYSEHEKKLIVAYRNKPEMQNSVDKLLDIYEPAETIAEDISETIRKIEAVSKVDINKK